MAENRTNVGLSNAGSSSKGLALLGRLWSGSASAIGSIGGGLKTPLPIQLGM